MKVMLIGFAILLAAIVAASGYGMVPADVAVAAVYGLLALGGFWLCTQAAPAGAVGYSRDYPASYPLAGGGSFGGCDGGGGGDGGSCG